MSKLQKIKIDVINECRNQLYFNQIEVQRLVENPSGLSYEKVVKKLLKLLKKNVILSSSIDLMEQYIPTPSQPKSVETTNNDATKSE